MARIQGTARNDILRGTDRNDLISGRGGNDRLYGFGGTDVIEGDNGDDRIFGGGGRDFLDGGAGNDLLSGGGGNDIFEFTDLQNGRDVIMDFQDGTDRMRIEFEGNETFGALNIRNNAAGDAIIRWDGGFITLTDVSAARLSAADFIFG